jgi:hypothetical protein
VLSGDVTHSRGGPGPPDSKPAGLDLHSHINATYQLRRALRAVGCMLLDGHDADGGFVALALYASVT